jgi:hypothetical protein
MVHDHSNTSYEGMIRTHTITNEPDLSLLAQKSLNTPVASVD